MKLLSIDALLVLLLSVALQGSFAASSSGSTSRHSRLRVAGPPLSQVSNDVLFGPKAFEHIQASTSSSHLAQANDNEHDEGNERMEALGLTLMLLGGIAFQMTIFYLVNFPHPGIRLTSWQVLSTTSSIFISVMLYSMIYSHILPRADHLQLLAATVAGCYLVSCAIVRFLKASAETTQALAMILGHVTGFAALHTCADLQKVTLFAGSSLRTSLWMTSVTVSAVVVLPILALCMDRISQNRELSLGKRDADLIVKTQDSIFGICISYSIVATIRFGICGDLQDYAPHAKLKGITQAHANQLLICGAIFGSAACLGPRLFQRFLGTGVVSRVFGIILQLQTLIFAWLVLFWAEWQLQILGLEGPLIGGSLVVAFMLTVFSCLAIFACSYIADRTTVNATDSIELALGLLMGLSWQRSCASVLEDISEGVHVPNLNIDPRLLTQISSVLLLLVGVPAWRLFILPRAMQLESMHEQEEQTLQKTLEAAAGKKMRSSVGGNLGWQFSTPRLQLT